MYTQYYSSCIMINRLIVLEQLEVFPSYDKATSGGEGIFFFILVFMLVCVSFCLSVTKFRHIYLSNYKSQILDILTHPLFSYAICWNSFLYQSSVNFLFNDDFVYLSLNFWTHFSKNFLSNILLQMLQILTQSL